MIRIHQSTRGGLELQFELDAALDDKHVGSSGIDEMSTRRSNQVMEFAVRLGTI